MGCVRVYKIYVMCLCHSPGKEEARACPQAQMKLTSQVASACPRHHSGRAKMQPLGTDSGAYSFHTIEFCVKQEIWWQN